MICSGNRNLTSNSICATMLNYFLSQVTKSKGHYQYKPQDLGHQHRQTIQTIDVPKISVNHQKILPERPVISSFLKLPPKQRPKQGHRSFPHAIQHLMNKASSCQHEHSGISPSGIDIVPDHSQYHNKEQSMRKDPSTGKHILKQNPANDLIDDIRQHGANCHIPVINMWPDHRESHGYNVEHCKGYSDVCEGEHCTDNIINMLKQM